MQPGYYAKKNHDLGKYFIEWEKAGWEGAGKVTASNYPSPSSANEEQEAQSFGVILVKIPELSWQDY